MICCECCPGLTCSPRLSLVAPAFPAPALLKGALPAGASMYPVAASMPERNPVASAIIPDLPWVLAYWPTVTSGTLTGGAAVKAAPSAVPAPCFLGNRLASRGFAARIADAEHLGVPKSSVGTAEGIWDELLASSVFESAALAAAAAVPCCISSVLCAGWLAEPVKYCGCDCDCTTGAQGCLTLLVLCISLSFTCT